MNELDSIMTGDSGVVADTSQLETETKPEAKVSTRKATAKPKAVQVTDDELPGTEVIRDRTDNEIVLEQNALMRGAKRIKIRLEQNKEIPPSGQFIGINGVGYLLVPGVDVEVPEFLLDALDAAVEDVPVLDERGNVAGYQKKTRFPYQIVRDRG